jgi:hypothetical protein
MSGPQISLMSASNRCMRSLTALALSLGAACESMSWTCCSASRRIPRNSTLLGGAFGAAFRRAARFRTGLPLALDFAFDPVRRLDFAKMSSSAALRVQSSK